MACSIPFGSNPLILHVGILYLSPIVNSNILAIKDDEFYCQSKEGKYDYACKRCINDEDCDYDYGKLSKFKTCQCSNLELVNKEGGMYLYIIQVFL